MTKTQQEGRHLINGIDPYEFTTEKSGGASIYSKHVPWSTVVHFRFLFSFGAMHDDEGKEGTAHFLEHMIFQGNPLYKDKFEIDEFSKKYTLDSLNAFTSYSNVCVHFRCLPEHASDAIEGIYQMIANAYLREEDIENERSIITQEAWSRYTNAKHIEYIKKERKNLYHDMPDRLRLSSPLGWPDTVAVIKKEDLEKAKENGFIQENLSLVIAGAISEEIMESARNFTRRLPSGTQSSKPFVPKELSSPLENVWIYTRSDMGLTNNKQAQVSIGGGTLKDKASTSAIKSMTSKLMYELLFKKIRHGHGWCYKVSASFGTSEDFSFGEIGTTIDPEHVGETLRLMWEIVNAVKAGEHVKEFEQEKQLAIERMSAAELTTGDITAYATDDLRFDSEIQARKKTFEEFAAVTYPDVVKLVTDTFDEKVRLIEAYLPDEFSAEDARKEISKLSF